MQKPKTNRRAQRQSKQPKTRTKTKKTPFGDVGEILGGTIGKMFNLDLSHAGRWLGSGVGSIFGSGDYTVAGQAPAHNVLFNSTQVPKFSTSHATNVISHREYVMDVYGTTNFTNSSFAINPANRDLFPWLSNVSRGYQQYKFHGLILEFKPLITDFVSSGAPGVIIMATNYDVNDPSYQSKHEMENSEFAVSVKPTMALVHGVECDVSQSMSPIKYVRAPGSALDLPLYDWGKFQIATQGNPSGQLIGELWVSYLVEFYKPILPPPGSLVEGGLATRTGVTSATPLGTATGRLVGDVEFNFFAGNILKLKGLLPKNIYTCQFYWVSTTTAALAAPSFGVVGGELISLWSTANASVADDGLTEAPAPSGGVSNTLIYNLCFKVDALVVPEVTLTLTGQTLPPTPILTINIQQVASTVIP